MANTNTKKPEDEVVPGLPDMSTINKDAVNTASANLSAARGALNNMSYDTFKQGTLYDGLKKSYEQQGKRAMQDTLGQVAARTGGMASSYATSAANQSYNNYMQTLEDAARAMYNEEYAKNRDKVDLAQQEYNNAYGEYRDDKADAWTRYNAENDAYWKNKNYNYQVGRDTLEDQRYDDAQTKERIATQKTDLYNLVASGGTPNKNDYPDLSDAEYNNIVATATGNRTDDNRLNVDKEFESIFGAEGFVWGDWNKDGKVDQNDSGFAPDFSTSSYGEDYWKQFHSDKQQGYADTDTKEAQDLVADIWATGGNPYEDDLVTAGYKTKNKDGTYSWTDAGLLAYATQFGFSDDELNQMLKSEGADWENIDWDRDGKVGSDDDNEDMSMAFINSSYGQEYWESIYNTAQNGYAEEDKTEAQDSAVDDINARIANGESLEYIAKDYKIVEDDDPNTVDRTWEEVTGMSKAEWQQRYNDNEVSNFEYPKSESGRTEIVKTLVASRDMNLSDKDIKNFDYLFGENAYDNVTTYIQKLAEIDPHTMTEAVFSDKMAELEESLPTKMNTDQIDEIIKKVNPEAWKAISDKTYFDTKELHFDPKKSLNGGIMK